ncbi:GNAT superfamily N-acetyltransferase [Saccharopolyspora lacisalsi]|uniref:GNAT superfamily N-acetyltransferase n=1 Tax=Halosaccharopolyspora lacisalsi TaxID=1000566 RepID=A0A839DU94_9PSEU|nr:GNAT family N-acetyltransferase [Halosaccharopolyspora lacisalsi]MBA8823846.1 GNAT superfamily N-acetyltransferase [Halosaccharopolyspora lacisalsi]
MEPTLWMNNPEYGTGRGALGDRSEVRVLGAALTRAHATAVDLPATVRTHQGVDIVLTQGQPQDCHAVAVTHHRCSPQTLITRYHAASSHLSEHWLAQLTAPEQGVCLLAWRDQDVVAMAQLMPVAQSASAELGVLVEDAWQQRGIGSALISTLMGLATATGIHTVHAHCLPGQSGVLRAAHRAGLDRIELTDDEAVQIRLPHPI